MDLIGLDVQERRRKAKYTLLQRTDKDRWEANASGKLARLGVGEEVYTHPQHPAWLIINGEHSKTAIVALLGHDEFSYEVVQGFNNPKLPFMLPSY